MRVLFGILVAAGLAVFATYLPTIAQTTLPAPVATVTALTGVPVQIIAANPTRRSIQICNVGASNAVWIWPGALAPSTSAYLIPPLASNVTACFTPPSGISTQAGNSWNAGSVSTGTTISVIQW